MKNLAFNYIDFFSKEFCYVISIDQYLGQKNNKIKKADERRISECPFAR